MIKKNDNNQQDGNAYMRRRQISHIIKRLALLLLVFPVSIAMGALGWLAFELALPELLIQYSWLSSWQGLGILIGIAGFAVEFPMFLLVSNGAAQLFKNPLRLAKDRVIIDVLISRFNKSTLHLQQSIENEEIIKIGSWINPEESLDNNKRHSKINKSLKYLLKQAYYEWRSNPEYTNPVLLAYFKNAQNASITNFTALIQNIEVNNSRRIYNAQLITVMIMIAATISAITFSFVFYAPLANLIGFMLPVIWIKAIPLMLPVCSGVMAIMAGVGNGLLMSYTLNLLVKQGASWSFLNYLKPSDGWNGFKQLSHIQRFTFVCKTIIKLLALCGVLFCGLVLVFGQGNTWFQTIQVILSYLMGLIIFNPYWIAKLALVLAGIMAGVSMLTKLIFVVQYSWEAVKGFGGLFEKLIAHATWQGIYERLSDPKEWLKLPGVLIVLAGMCILLPAHYGAEGLIAGQEFRSSMGVMLFFYMVGTLAEFLFEAAFIIPFDALSNLKKHDKNTHKTHKHHQCNHPGHDHGHGLLGPAAKLSSYLLTPIAKGMQTTIRWFNGIDDVSVKKIKQDIVNNEQKNISSEEERNQTVLSVFTQFFIPANPKSENKYFKILKQTIYSQ